MVTSGNAQFTTVQGFCKNKSVQTSLCLDTILTDAGIQSTDHLVVCVTAGRRFDDVELGGYDAPEVALWVQVCYKLQNCCCVLQSRCVCRLVTFRLQWHLTKLRQLYSLQARALLTQQLLGCKFFCLTRCCCSQRQRMRTEFV